MALARYLFIPKNLDAPEEGAVTLPALSSESVARMTPEQLETLRSQLTDDGRRALASLATMTPTARATGVLYNTCDPDLARAWLTEALRLDADAIERLDGRVQVQAVMDQWQAWANFCSALNIRCNASARYSAACEAAWGVESGVSTSLNWLDKNGRPHTNGEWRGRFWRHYASNGGRTPWNVCVFGHAHAPPHRSQEYVDAMRSGRFFHSPTGETHRVWIQPDNTLGGYQTIFPDEVPYYFDGRRADRWTDLQYKGLLGPCGSPGFLGCGQSDEERGLDVFTLPPMRWYWELLRPVLEHARTVGPLAFVWECFLDVKARNLAMARKLKLPGVDALVGRAERLAADRIEEAETERNEDIEKFRSTAGMAGDFAKMIAGVGAAILSGLWELGGMAEGAAYTDHLGRLLPVFELFRLVDSVDEVEAVQRVMPQFPAGYRPMTPFFPVVVLGANAAAAESSLSFRGSVESVNAGAQLAVNSDVPGAEVQVNAPGDDNPFFPAPWGPRTVAAGVVRVTVRAPGRREASRDVTLPPGPRAVLAFTSADLPPDGSSQPSPDVPPVSPPQPPKKASRPLLVAGAGLAALVLAWMAYERNG